MIGTLDTESAGVVRVYVEAELPNIWESLRQQRGRTLGVKKLKRGDPISDRPPNRHGNGPAYKEIFVRSMIHQINASNPPYTLIALRIVLDLPHLHEA